MEWQFKAAAVRSIMFAIKRRIVVPGPSTPVPRALIVIAALSFFGFTYVRIYKSLYPIGASQARFIAIKHGGQMSPNLRLPH